MAANRVATFLEHLRASRLLSPEQLVDVERRAPAAGDDPTPLGKEIRRRGWLTAYQIKQVARGRAGLLVLGPYRLLDLLGEGGMGQVFKACHAETDRTVALKVIRKERLENPAAVKRFQREVRSAEKLSHPNIVAALDAGEVDGTHYLAMEFVEGTDLDKLLKEKGPLPINDACACIRQAALGLQHAFEKGLVHRDVKPSNLIRDTKGTCKLLDLGLARALDTPPDGKLTRVGAVVGTPEYLAPEQAKDASAVDVRADLYSLGCTFYHLLTGQPPFRGETPTDVALQHFNGIPAPLDEFRTDVPAGLQAVLSRLMAKKPEDRYATPAELAAALLPFTTDHPKPGTAAKQANHEEMATDEDVAEESDDSSDDDECDGPPPNYGRRRLLVAGAIVLLVAGGLGAVHLALSHEAHPATEPTSQEVAQAPATHAAPETRPEPVPEVKKATKVVADPPANPDANAPPKFEVIPDPPREIPAPKEDPKPKPKEDPKPKPKDPPAQPAKKFRPPVADAIAKARSSLREKYRDEYARKRREDVEALVERFLNLVPDSASDPITQYALLIEARDLLVQLGKIEKAVLIYDEIDKYFECDSQRLKIDFLSRLRITDAATGDAALHAAVMALVPVLDRDAYADVHLLLNVATLAASRTGATPAIRFVQSLATEIGKMEKEYGLVKWAVQTLATRPDDPKANYAWGRYLTLVKGNWDKGLPFLAKGSNVDLKRVAQLDIDGPREAARQKSLGDQWTEVSKKEQGSPQKRALVRAKFWYEQAVERLEASARQAAQDRIREIDNILSSDDDGMRAQMTSALANAATQQQQAVAAAAIAEQQARNSAIIGAIISEQIKAQQRAMEDLARRQQAYTAHINRAQQLMNQKQFAQAAGEFSAALAAKPGDRAAANGLQQAQQAMRGR